MVLEAIILCLDNSDWTRNGDYYPTRFQNQIEAGSFIIENLCSSNPENTIGIMTMAGKRVEILSSLTNKESNLLAAMTNIPLDGECDIESSLNIAILCLKHRINKNHKQRIILFIGSPLNSKKDNLIQIGRKLKKYNVALDIISFGNVDKNRELLNILYKEVNNCNNSYLLEVPIGLFITDSLLNSPIMNKNQTGYDQLGKGETGDAPGNNQSMGLSQFEQDMSMALQMSLEETQKRKAEDEKFKTEEEQLIEKAKLLSLQEINNKIKKENEDNEKIANEILENKDFINDILNQIGEGEEDISKEKKDDKKKIDNEILENKDFINDLLNQIGEGEEDINKDKKDNKEKKEENIKNKEDKKEDRKEDKKDDNKNNKGED